MMVTCKDCGREHHEEAWCFCTPQSVIDHHDLNMKMWMEGFDPRIEADRIAYSAAHYGRHDVSALGLMAVTFPVPEITPDDRVPQGWMIAKDSELGQRLGGKHRWSNTLLSSGRNVMWYDHGTDCPNVGCRHGWIRSGRAQGVVVD
jgi:hypothetical protein